MSDTIVYWSRDGLSYVGCFDGEWLQWPATSGGWLSRKRVSESAADECDEVGDARIADLSLRLSGAAR